MAAQSLKFDPETMTYGNGQQILAYNSSAPLADWAPDNYGSFDFRSIHDDLVYYSEGFVAFVATAYASPIAAGRLAYWGRQIYNSDPVQTMVQSVRSGRVQAELIRTLGVADEMTLGPQIRLQSAPRLEPSSITVPRPAQQTQHLPVQSK